STPPTAILVNNKDTNSIKFKIDDQFSGISSYQLYLNNKWVLADYDAKFDLLTYTFDEVYAIEKQKAILNNEKAKWTIKLSDKQGNKLEKSWEIDW
ncbi:MAG: hypothetical protein ACOVP1_02430, partial [Bacteroidia bacterium]